LDVITQAILLWRIILGCVLGLVFAGMASLVHPLPAGAWFALAFIGSAVGAVRQVAAISRQGPGLSSRISELTVFQQVLVLFVVAAMGGGGGQLIEPIVGPYFAVAAVILAPLVIGPVFGALSHERVTLPAVAACSVVSLVGYYVPDIIEWLFAIASP
jgi:hypothetical protein